MGDLLFYVYCGFIDYIYVYSHLLCLPLLSSTEQHVSTNHYRLCCDSEISKQQSNQTHLFQVKGIAKNLFWEV